MIDIVTGLLFTPFMLRILGKSEYGLYQLVSSVVAYLSLIGLGFSSSYQRFYFHAKRDKSTNAISSLNGLFMLIYLIMSAICLVAGIFMVINTEIFFSTGLTAKELEKTKVLLLLMVFNMALTFPESLFTSYIIS